MKQVIYVAHPVSGDVKGNCDKVVGWLRWLTANDPTRIYIAPWVGEVLAYLDVDPLPVDLYDRVLSDDEEVVRGCDGICVTGVGDEGTYRRANGFLKSTGMTREVAAAALSGGLVFDLSKYAKWEDAEDLRAEYYADGTDFIDDHLIRPRHAVAP